MDIYFGFEDEINSFETRGGNAIPIRLLVTHIENRRHLPLVELKRAS